MSKREFLMLAHNYVPNQQSVAMWRMSTKLDGMRAFWDGGVSRGVPCDQVPYANVEKDARLLVRPVSTGLWSRYGKVIHAPNALLDKLPKIALDGELYIDVGQFQTVMSTVKQHVPSVKDWEKIKFMVFDSPPLEVVF
jgi:ATP-dependent DNA ligase